MTVAQRYMWVAAVAFSALVGCGHSAPVVGTVIDKQFVAAHDENGWGVIAWVPKTETYEDCSYNSATKSESCIPQQRTTMQPLYGPTVDHIPDRWYLTVKDIKGHNRRVGVSRVVYDRTAIGLGYDSRAKVAA